MVKSTSLLLLLLTPAFAQLVPVDRPIPRTQKPPVVFLNGYQQTCPATFSGTFGAADQILQRNGEVSIFFDNCAFPNKPSIEDLGARFATFLSGLKYEDGQAVTQVDVVAHSMGGLIVRSYLTGKQNADGTFAPPADTKIRKLIFLATPHFGTPIAGVALGLGGGDKQVDELSSGSRFLFDLATWNQGTDDLRGIDALAVIGNAGTGLYFPAGASDGVVPLTSASLSTFIVDRTRIVSFCHTTGGLIDLLGACRAGSQSIASLTNDTQDTTKAVVSFLNNTDDWKSIGQAPAQNDVLKSNSGVLVAWKSTDDQFRQLDSATFLKTATTTDKLTNTANRTLASADFVPAAQQNIELKFGNETLNGRGDLAPGGTFVYTYKTGPAINRVLPSASAVFPYQLAPGMFISIYGGELADATATAPGLPFPTRLGTTEVRLGNTLLPLQIVTKGQVNAVLPTGVTGLQTLNVKTSAGQNTINVYIVPSLPTLFTTDGTGKGNVAALNAVTGTVINPANPLRAGDFVSLFLTGLGDTEARGGLDYAKVQPTVLVGGIACPVSYAGRAPGFVGLDQVNCQIPSGLPANAATSVVVVSGGKSGNQGTLPIQ